ncbi:MAG TPA: TolC family protein [Planctomycetaceae bacterium]|nr:TolC family protein [Planctomycetaceae bacterium]
MQLVAGSDDDDGAGRESFSGAPPIAVASPSVLGLDEAIETGLVQNPDLVALRQNEGVSAAALGVAQTYPINPWVQIQVTPLQHNTEGGSGSVGHYVLVMQTLQIAHQQQFREDMAASQLNQVRWNIHNAELLNMAQTTRLFLWALYQRGIRDLARLTAEQNQQLLEISQRQLDAGTITNADVAIIRIDAGSTRQQSELAEANYQTALLDLRRQLNLPLEAQLELTGELTALRWKSARDAALSQIGSVVQMSDLDLTKDADLIKRLTDGRPDLMAARADITTAHANYNLANAARTPDVQIGPYYQRDDFATLFFGFRTQVDIPVLNNGKPLARQRAAEYQQRHITWQQLQDRAEIEAIVAVDRYERARKLVNAARADFRENLPAELQRLEDQFKANEVDVLRVFQGRTSLIQNRRAMLDLLNELAQATTAVTAATGIPPKALVSFASDEET